MKRKVLAGVVTVSMLIGLTACGSMGAESNQQGETVSGKASLTETADVSTIVSNETAYPEDGDKMNFEGVTLNIAHSTTGEVGDALQAQFDAFEELTGCEIEVELLSSDSEEAVYTLEVRAATGNLPDIFQSSIGAQLDKLDPAENIYDLSGQDWIRENVAASYLELVSDSETGAVYCIPMTTSNVAGCLYNKTVYEELNLEIPTTWEEFLANCEIIKRQTDRIPVSTPYSDGAGAQILFFYPSIIMSGMERA